MTIKKEVKLGPFQHTLFLPLWARANETKKENPLLIDSKAVEIIESAGFDFAANNKLEKIKLISWISRCRKYDEVINKFIIANPDGTIVNIGCGMDTYYERAINSTLRWYELDLPDVIELKRKFFEETENRRFISKSFLSTQWFEQIKPKKKVLFISSDVFCYFDQSIIKDFLLKIADCFPSAELLFNVTSANRVKEVNDLILKTILSQVSFMKWQLRNKEAILFRDKRIQIIGTYYPYKQKYLNHSCKNRIIGSISDFLNMQYILHLKIE
jgi:O-methyltransferase involved in polyketide biosynthesis